MKKFSNYQIEVELEPGPKETEVATVFLSGDLAEKTGWKKRVFICRAKEILTGKVLRPVHPTSDQFEIIHKSHSESTAFEIRLNSSLIRLFQKNRKSRLAKWLKPF